MQPTITPPNAAFAGRRRSGAAKTKAAASLRNRSQAERRIDSERVQRCMDETFYDFPASIQTSHCVNGTSLRLAASQMLYPDEGGGVDKLAFKQSRTLRNLYAIGDIPEALLRRSAEELAVQLQ